MPNPEFQHFKDGNVTYDVSEAVARGHIEVLITAVNGIHDIRYYDGTLAYYDRTLDTPAWVEIETGSGGIVELTAQQFSQLTEEEKNANVIYIITDGLDGGTGELTGIFTGTHQAWNLLTDNEKAIYSLVFFTDDYESATITFTGATSESNGVAGIVPAPQIADRDKFLKGDGTWAAASGGFILDDVPTENSNNTVKSGGVYSELSAINTSLSNKYGTDDTAETDIDDADYFPFYDSSATAKRKSLWSNIKSVLKTYFDTLYATTTTVTNKHKVTRKTVNTSSWSTDTTSQSGSTLYKKSIALSNVYVDCPSVEISTSSGTGLPTTAQQTAYDLLQYVTVDGTTMYLYASAIPSDTFYIQIEGVD